MDERLKRLIARREAAAKEREQLLAQRKAIIDLAEEEARQDLSDEEDTEFRQLTEKVKVKDEELRSFDERISELTDEIERSRQVSDGADALRRAMQRVQVVSEERTYERGNGNSYLRDLVMSQLKGDDEARSRLNRHANEVRSDKEFRALDRTDTQGGYFVPPLWLMQQWVELARAGRATANVVRNLDLPSGTDSINIPRVATGTATAVQDGDNTAIANTDMVDGFVTAPVRTIAGEQDVAVQLLEQSPVNFDEVIFQDLLADYATRVDQQVISGTGNNGQVLGIRNTANVIGITWTEAAPTVPLLYSRIADAIQRIHTQRFQAPEVIVMHPRRWGWFLSALDTTDRPLVLPSSHNPQNAAGILSAVAAEQVVGNIHGLPVVTDPNLPTNLGTAPNNTQDPILVLRASDLFLYESGIRTRVLQSASPSGNPAVGGRTLTTTLQVYGYLAFTAGRYPTSVAQISGTGLEAPTF
jgi:HK97 family phage major capsid protein